MDALLLDIFIPAPPCELKKFGHSWMDFTCDKYFSSSSIEKRLSPLKSFDSVGVMFRPLNVCVSLTDDGVLSTLDAVAIFRTND